jgi:hypothetical protein
MATGNKTHKLIAAGSATLIAEPALAMAHQGGLGIIVGLVVGAVAYGILDEVEQRTDGQLALPVRPRSAAAANPKTQGKSSLGYRLLVGKSVREEEGRAPTELEEVADEEESIDLEELLELGELHPHVNTMLSNRVAILGMSGAGKSNLVADLVEELGQYDAPLIMLDHKGEYGPLCATPYLLRPVRANAQNLTPANTRAFAQRIMTERLQVVVDLSSYRDADAALVMAGVIAGVAKYQKPLDKANRITCTVVLEEAHYWLPQDQSQSTIRGIKNRADENGQTLLAYLQQTFFQLSKIGRSLGMGLVVATQRPADVDNRLISQAEWYFLLKVMLPADLARYRGFGAPDGVAAKLNPKKGEAYVIGPDGTHGVYHLRRRYSPDESSTPGLANIKNATPVATATRSPVPGSRMRGMFERADTSGNVPAGNTGNTENALREPGNAHSLDWEHSRSLGNTGNALEEEEATGNEPEGYTHEEETQVLLAYAALLKSGVPVTRRGIRNYLEWPNRRFTRVIKPVCDKHNIAMRES